MLVFSNTKACKKQRKYCPQWIESGVDQILCWRSSRRSTISLHTRETDRALTWSGPEGSQKVWPTWFGAAWPWILMLRTRHTMVGRFDRLKWFLHSKRHANYRLIQGAKLAKRLIFISDIRILCFCVISIITVKKNNYFPTLPRGQMSLLIHAHHHISYTASTAVKSIFAHRQNGENEVKEYSKWQDSSTPWPRSPGTRTMRTAYPTTEEPQQDLQKTCSFIFDVKPCSLAFRHVCNQLLRSCRSVIILLKTNI